MKKGVFFSLDALIALIIIFLTFLAVFPLVKYSVKENEIKSDVIVSLSELKIGEIDNTDVHQLIEDKEITDLNKSILEQIGEFYATDISKARDLASSVFFGLELGENFGIWYGNDLIYSKFNPAKPYENAKNIEVERQSISGIQKDSNAKGYSVRASLSKSAITKYFYFGGYVGDGNVSVNVDYDGVIKSAGLEIAVNKGFDIYINGDDLTAYAGHFDASVSESEPRKYSLDAYLNDFIPGLNTVKFVGKDLSVEEDLYIAGGFLKINYDTDSAYESPTRYYFPGVEGLVNIYDGFYVPSSLLSMDISLHLDTDYEAFLTIGDTEVFRGTTDGEETIAISDSTLSSLLNNYIDIKGETVPLRLGLEEFSYVPEGSMGADVISVTDLYGRLAGVKEAIENSNFALIDAILNIESNRVGLAGYHAHAYDHYFHELSNDENALNAMVTYWQLSDEADSMCSGINRGIRELVSSHDNFLAAYYKFDEPSGTVAYDSSDNENDGTIVGDVGHVDGKYGLAYEFTAPDVMHVEVPDSPSFYIESDHSFSFASWINTDFTGDLQTIAYKLASGKSNYHRIHAYVDQEGIFKVGTYSSHLPDSYQVFDSGVNVATGTWQHIAFVRDALNDKFKMYVNGNLVQEFLDTRTFYKTPEDHLYIGRYRGRSTRTIPLNQSHFRGAIDELMFFTKALTSENIERIYDNDNSVVCGDAWVSEGEGCDDGNTIDGDGCSSSCQVEDRYKTIVLMGRGIPSESEKYRCTKQMKAGSSSGKQDAILAACEAYEDYGIIVDVVAFGADAEVTTLQAIASCGHGDYYYADVSDIVAVYEAIANNILEVSYHEQTITAEGDVFTQLWPDSYINFNYVKPEMPYGLIVSSETENFDEVSEGVLNIPTSPDVSVVDAKAISYSGPRWTHHVEIDSVNVYNLEDYGSTFVQLGDPYAVNIPVGEVDIGEDNVVKIVTAISPSEVGGGSTSDKVVYTIVKPFVSYSGIAGFAEGCEWSVTDLEGPKTIKIPSDYSGNGDPCTFNPSSYNCDDYTTDAIDSAVCNLFMSLDFDDDGVIDIIFNENDFAIELNEITGIPFTWSTEVKIKTWD